jgi:hypothetical protein
LPDQLCSAEISDAGCNDSHFGTAAARVTIGCCLCKISIFSEQRPGTVSLLQQPAENAIRPPVFRLAAIDDPLVSANNPHR